MGSQVERTPSKLVAGGPGQSHICMQINQEEQLGSKIDHTTKGPSMGK